MGLQAGHMPGWINLQDRSLEAVVKMWLSLHESQAVQVQQLVKHTDEERIKRLENTVHGVGATLAALNDRLTRVEQKLLPLGTPWVPTETQTRTAGTAGQDSLAR